MTGLKQIILPALLLINCFLYGAKSGYAINLIPDSLLKNANSIIRLSETYLQVENAGKVKLHQHFVITVMNQAASGELNIILNYGPLKQLKSFEASLYNQDGKLMNRHGIADMEDFAFVNGFSLFNDLRYKKLQTSGGIFPVTIDYTCTYEYNGIFDYPDWILQRSHQSVETSNYEIEAPSDIAIFYKSHNLFPEPQPEIIKSAKRTSYHWHVNGLKSPLIPKGSYDAFYYLPSIDFCPDTFEIQNYRGSWKSWKAYGQISYQIFKERQNMPAEMAKEAIGIVNNLHTEREKAEALYNFLQREFRFVNVHIKNNYMMPLDVATVHAVRYGDSRALCNYMCTLLNYVGIKASIAFVNYGSGEHPIDTTFPGNYFGHTIVYAELSDGPLWLECSSNAMPFGQLGTSTENRYALIFDKDGGRIMKTPVSSASLNKFHSGCTVEVSKNLQARISVSAELEGEFKVDAKSFLASGTKEQHTNYVFNELSFRQPEDFSINHISDTLSEISFELSGNTEKIYDFKTGNKVFLPSSMIKKWCGITADDSTQRVDLLMGFPQNRKEELVYKLSAYNKIDLPGSYNMDNEVVQFSRKCTQQPDSSVIISTEFTFKKHIIPPSEIMLLKESLQTVNKYLQQKLIVETN